MPSDLEKNIRQHASIIILGGFLLTVSFLLTRLIFHKSNYGLIITCFAASLIILVSRKRSLLKIVSAYMISAVIALLAVYTVPSLNVGMALTAILAIIILSLLKLQHAPAVGISLAFFLNQFSIGTASYVLSAILLLFFSVQLLRDMLDNPKKYTIIIERDKFSFNF